MLLRISPAPIAFFSPMLSSSLVFPRQLHLQPRHGRHSHGRAHLPAASSPTISPLRPPFPLLLLAASSLWLLPQVRLELASSMAGAQPQLQAPCTLLLQRRPPIHHLQPASCSSLLPARAPRKSPSRAPSSAPPCSIFFLLLSAAGSHSARLCSLRDMLCSPWLEIHGRASPIHGAAAPPSAPPP